MSVNPATAQPESRDLASSIARCEAVLAHIRVHGDRSNATAVLRAMMERDSLLQPYLESEEDVTTSYARARGDLAYQKLLKRSRRGRMGPALRLLAGKTASLVVLPVLLIFITAVAGKSVGLDLQASEFRDQRLFELKVERIKSDQELADKLYGAVSDTARTYLMEEQKYFARYRKALEDKSHAADNGNKWLRDHPRIAWDPRAEIEAHYRIINQLRSHSAGLPKAQEISELSGVANQAMKAWAECVKVDAAARAKPGTFCTLDKKPFGDLVVIYGDSIQAMISEAETQRKRGRWSLF